MFNDSYVNIVTITFSALICIEILNVYTQINHYNYQMFLMQVATGASYFLSIYMMRSYFQTSYMDTIFFIKIGIITLITWGPIQLIYITMEYLQPSENTKLMEAIRYNNKDFD